MQEKSSFTLIEVVVVIGILSSLILALLFALDPLEQINRSKDVELINASKEVVDGVFRFNTTTGQIPFTTEIQGEALNESGSKDVIQKLVSNEDLKKDFIEQLGNNAAKLFFSGTYDLSHVTMCFVPTSKYFKKSRDTLYDKFGNNTDCTQNTCYHCLGKIDMITTPASLVEASVTSDGTCDGFDPERPDYPFTCNYSSKWSIYGCTNYCIGDSGCDSFCPAGQRHLKKTYYTFGLNFVQCLSHYLETTDDYCVSGIAANCTKMPYPSSDSHFIWGCSNPRRPYTWK